MEHDADAIILGGGMVGATIAGLLAGGGRSVIVVEGSPAGPPPEGGDLRVSAINRAGIETLRRVGAWARGEQWRHQPFRHLRVWNRDSGAGAAFDATEAGLDTFGAFVENAVLQQGLEAALADHRRVAWRRPATATAFHADAGAAHLEIDGETTLSAPLLIGADGPNSRIRTLCGITTSETDYAQRALIINVTSDADAAETTWQRFTPAGPQAWLPLPGGQASLVWYGDPGDIRILENLDDDTLAAEIQAAFPAEVGTIRAVHGRASFPVVRRHARAYAARRVALVGDAAHSIHPLMGQGLNLGLQGAESLADALLAAPGRDPAAALAEYERAHRPRALAMMAATDACHRLFTREPGGITGIGDGLLRLAGATPVGRRPLLRHAMGLSPLGAERPEPGDAGAHS